MIRVRRQVPVGMEVLVKVLKMSKIAAYCSGFGRTARYARNM